MLSNSKLMKLLFFENKVCHFFCQMNLKLKRANLEQMTSVSPVGDLKRMARLRRKTINDRLRKIIV